METPKNPESQEDADKSCEKSCGQTCGSSSFCDGDKIGRSTFMKGVLGTAAVAWGGATLYPVFSYLKPKPGEEDEKTQVSSLEVCKTKDLPPGTGKNFRFGSTPALIVHTKDGEMHAFKAICTHLGCTVQYQKEKDDIYCACHGGQYDAHTGKNIAGPPPKPLTALKVTVDGDKIIVSLA